MSITDSLLHQNLLTLVTACHTMQSVHRPVNSGGNRIGQMSLRFPAVEDIPLANAPLSEVVCQVRFPTILSIGLGLPAEFQEAIRHRFPEIEEEQNVLVQIRAAGDAQSANAELTGRVFQFRSADGANLISLGTEAYALSTTNYGLWADFARDLALVHNAAVTVYNLPYAKRVGLRYINQIDLDNTGCTSLDELKQVLRPELVSLLTTSAWNRPEEMVSQVRLKDSDGQLVLRVAARMGEKQPPVIIIDFDYYEEGRVPIEEVVHRCGVYHDVIYRGFRWAMNPEQLHLFEPIAMET
jgi:uncharacterized protein (TIGR04255 family)